MKKHRWARLQEEHTENLYTRGLELNNASGFKIYSIRFVVLLFACSLFLTSCFVADNSNSAASNTQYSAITPVGVPATCLTVHPPLLAKLTDGYYKLVEVINNCGGKMAGPLDVTAQITTGTMAQNANIMGPVMIVANSKAIYSSSGGQKSQVNKELHFISPVSSTVLVAVYYSYSSSN